MKVSKRKDYVSKTVFRSLFWRSLRKPNLIAIE